MVSRILSSSDLNCSASLTMRSISWSDSLFDFWLICSCFWFPVPLRSLAVTVKIPSTDKSYVISIYGFPRGAGGIPSKLNCPSKLLSFVKGRSPSNTLMVTAGWLSTFVVKVFFLFVGIVVFLGINTVIVVPLVSMPNDRGHTSKSRISPAPLAYDLSWDKTAAWTAAPYATASSGFSDFNGSFPLKYSLINC